MNFLKEAEKKADEITADRRYLHEHPELSDEEVNTLKFIKEKLGAMDMRYAEIPKGGIIAMIGSSLANDSKTVLLRADIDALAIEESPDNLKQKKQCISGTPGTAHLCGHDAHTAMLLGAAGMLKAHEKEILERGGRVIFLFERGEEKGGQICELLKFLYDNKIRVDTCFAEHVRGTGLKAGTAAVLDGPVTAGCYGFAAEIHGKGGHGSAPHLANSPIDCFAAVYQAISEIPVKYIPAEKTCSFSLGHVEAGHVWNIIPDTLCFAGSYRYYEQEVGKTVYDKFHQILDSICAAYGCTCEVKQQIGPIIPTVNHPVCAETARKALRNMGEGLEAGFKRWTASESFSAATKMYPGAMAFIGIENDDLGSGADNHSPYFDIDESALPLGAALYAQYTWDYIESGERIEFDGGNETPDELRREVNYS